MVEYKFSRLGFIRDKIEPLGEDESFRILTPQGNFEMTKGEFYAVFGPITRTMSYKDRGVFHYSRTPVKALQFKVR